jgi:hypothetical protein
MFGSFTTTATPFDVHWSHYPRTYVAPRVPKDVALINHIDGDLTKDIWSRAPFSEYFDDIRGEHDAPPSDRPSPTCSTRFKMMWDEDYLYVGAILTSDFTTTATFHNRNSPIFQQDSDFEVFMDPIGSCQNYKEFEVNAINTVWNLMLDRPYDDDGREHSGRIAKPGDPMFYEVYHQKSATRVLEGQLNDPERGATWSVEMAFAHNDTLSHYHKDDAEKPVESSRWRINFSRVEKRGNINWTWQPQIVWDAAKKRYSGLVKMHLPDAWGYVVFGNDRGQASSPRDPSWPARFAAANVYYAQQEYKRCTGAFAKSVRDLGPWLDADVVRPFSIQIRTSGNHNKTKDNVFVADIIGSPDNSFVSITDDRHLVVRSKELEYSLDSLNY